ncbi:MAG: ACT domain-containing protein, partial [Desulfurivibrionaceae bacterium]
GNKGRALPGVCRGALSSGRSSKKRNDQAMAGWSRGKICSSQPWPFLWPFSCADFPFAESVPAANVHTRFIMINRNIPDMIGASGISIASYLNASNGTIGYNIIDLESGIPQTLVVEIEAHSGGIRTRGISFQEQTISSRVAAVPTVPPKTGTNQSVPLP